MKLDEILEAVRARAAERRRRRPMASVERDAVDAPAPRGLAAALRRAPHGLGLIAELKKRSPSAGVLRAPFDVTDFAAAYVRGGAHALSVLTEADFFDGALEDLERAAGAGVPRLQKDFVLDEFQILEGRAAGADAILLIAEALPPDRAHELCGFALELGLDVLFEAHGAANVRRVAAEAERAPDHVLVGINNRDLRTFQVTLETSFRALRELPPELLVVAESGIRTPADVAALRQAGARGILVGESLLRQPDLEAAVRELLSGLGEPHA